jgi:uncharacterized protein with GYD domain
MMAKYISLISFTQEGLKNVKDTRKRAQGFADRARQKGIEIKETYWTVGRYDIVHVFEAPDDQAAAAISIALGSIGNVRTETMRAFEAEDMSKILSEVYELQTAAGSLK